MGYSTWMNLRNKGADAYIHETVLDYLRAGSIQKLAIEELVSRVDLSFLDSKTPSSIVKNSEQLFREYELEKWSGELERLLSVTVLPVDGIQPIFTPDNAVITVRILDEVYRTDLATARKFYIDCLVKFFGEYVSEFSALLDVGAGTGATLLPLVESLGGVSFPIYATDLSPSGLVALKRLARLLKLNVETNTQDFFQGLKLEFELPENSLILTSFSLSCAPTISHEFFRDVIALKPKYVLHIESVYSSLDSEKYLDSIALKYIEWNNYNQDLLPKILRYIGAESEYEVKYVSPVFFGQNPLFPVSLVLWGKIESTVVSSEQ